MMIYVDQLTTAKLRHFCVNLVNKLSQFTLP